MTILSFLGRLMGGGQESVDVEADAIIRAFFKRNPDAAYRATKLAMELSQQAEQAVTPPPVAPKPRNWFAMLRDNFAF